MRKNIVAGNWKMNLNREEGIKYTGEVSAQMVNSLNVKYTILGHSERREYFNETNIELKQKVDLSLKNNLEIIFFSNFRSFNFTFK